MKELKQKRLNYIYDNNKKIIEIIKDELIRNGTVEFELNQLWDDSTPISITADELVYYFSSIDCYTEVFSKSVLIILN